MVKFPRLNRLMIILGAIICLVFVTLWPIGATADPQTVIFPSQPFSTPISQPGYNNDPIILPPILLAIEYCESGGRQFDSNGQVLKGKVNHQDLGILQINAHYHQAEADALSLDLTTKNGNERFGLWLYKKQGTAPWFASKFCWFKIK